MNVTESWQRGSRVRGAELNPFPDLSEPEKPKPGGTVRREDPSGTLSGYGCVDWYQYPLGDDEPQCAVPRRGETSPRQH